MSFEINKVMYTGKINETPLGVNKVMLGGQGAYSFHDFEGTIPNKPKLGLQVWDFDPGESFAGPLAEAYAGVLGDPGAWAKKAVEYGAAVVSVHLKSSDPNDKNTGPDEAIATVAKVVEAVDVPIIVFGVDNPDKDKETLSAVAEKFASKNLILGPVTEKNYKQVGAQALAYGHSVIARTPIDVNLAKQLNILLMDLGITPDKILIDPNTGGLGYGMEYCYSVMERINMAALIQQDDKLQQPIVNILGEEIWKLKEVNQSTSEYPTLGDQLSRGVLMEVTEAVSLLSAGSSLLIMAHPTSLKLAREYIDLAFDGGSPARDFALDVPVTDLSGLASLAEAEKKAVVEKKAAEAPKPVAEKKVPEKSKPASKAEFAPAPKTKAEEKRAPEALKPAVKAALAPTPETKAEKVPKLAPERSAKLAFEINKVKYTGKINETPLGVAKVMLGGQAAYSFHDFEGALPNKPKLGLQVWDFDPGDSYVGPLAEAYAGVLGDPAAWAKKAVEYGADVVSVHLKSSDPNDKNTGPDEAIATVAKVVEAVNVPIVVFGVDNPDKDRDTLSAVAEKFASKNLILGPVTDKNYKQVGAQALAYGHSVIARTPIDVNLAKQLNILLMDLGITPDKILIDPNTGGLGYGMEYCYSVMERINMAALIQQDDKLQQPIVNILGEEIWKLKEVNQSTSEYPTLGDQLSRGVLMEVTEAVSLLSAGSSLLIMAHPTSLKLVREYIGLVSDGGSPTSDFALEVPVTDLASVALPAAAEKKAAPEKKAEEAPKPAAKAEPAPAPETKAPEAPKLVAAPAPESEKKAEEAPKPAAASEPVEIYIAKPRPQHAQKAAKRKLGGTPMTAEQIKSLEKPEEAVSNQIINELDRVHMRTPRY